MSEKRSLISKPRISKLRNNFRLNIRDELKAYSMVFGILLVVFAAVILPDIGASGGYLHSEYSQYISLTYIYACAGWRCSRKALSRARRGGCLLVVGQAHAWLTTPLLAALLGFLFDCLGADHRLLEGWQLAACGGGGAWLSVGLLTSCTTLDDDADGLAFAVISAAVGSALALPLLPLSHFIFCGSAYLQSLAQLLPSRLAATVGFSIGSTARWLRLEEEDVAEVSGVQMAVLFLLYTECCSGVRAAAIDGALQPKDVLLAMALVWSCLAVSGAALAATTLLCGHHTGSKMYALAGAGNPVSSGHGLSRLPALLAMPARAAALTVLIMHKNR